MFRDQLEFCFESEREREKEEHDKVLIFFHKFITR
jgi:hypothetical protein